MNRQLGELEKAINYKFKNIEYLKHALTHKSACVNHHLQCNERLEFLGDAVLELSISTYLYNNFPKMIEGKMAKLRAALVCQTTLASIAEEIKLGEYLALGKGEMLSYGNKKPSILSDAVEAIFGAVYLDSGYEYAYNCIIGLFKPIMSSFVNGEMDSDYKTKLQEVLQKDGTVKIKYVTVKQEGQPHDMKFYVDVFCDDVKIGEGIGKSKKIAEQSAAKQALESIAKGTK